jgi:anti-sigma factor RsiW
LVRPLEKHIDNDELHSLVPSRTEAVTVAPQLSRAELSAAQLHVRSCLDCGKKVWKYWLLVNRVWIVGSESAPPGPDCPRADDVNWHELASGHWPEFKAAQLIKHAALCEHCGPLLRAATRMEPFPTADEEQLIEGLRAKFDTSIAPQAQHSPFRQVIKWLAPVMAAVVIAGAWATRSLTSPRRLSGPEMARFAVTTHRRHAEGRLPLQVQTDSEQALNRWFSENSSFALALPASTSLAREGLPYRLQGARFVALDGTNVAFVAYQMPDMQTPPASVSLMITPDRIAVAGGGVEAQFTKVQFHYARLDGYKVVTWSVHGLTYALVSQEDDTTQRSCMVCHSLMGDRDLSHTSTPLRGRGGVQPVWQ